MEMMHGKTGPFHYVHCQGCGSTYQPFKLDDYGKYYPQSYYSFQYKEPTGFPAKFRQLKRKLRNTYYYFGTGLIGKFLAKIRPCPINHLSQHVQLSVDMSVLEIGSGTGELLHEIADLGIRRTVGLDPFVPESIFFKNGATVYKSSIGELEKLFGDEKFDLILFNHSLEHSPTPYEDLRLVAQSLKSNGEILIRLPVSGSVVSEFYKEHWWSLDAPRHIYLFSTTSMPLLAEKCGLEVKRMHFEGTIDDYLASEQHKAGISLLDDRSYVVSKNFNRFSSTQLKQYESDVKSQNLSGTAGLAGFVLQHKHNQ